MRRNINENETKIRNMNKEIHKNRDLSEKEPDENKNTREENERGIVARLKSFPKSRRKSVMERSRKIAANRLTPNASQELHRFESHNPQRDFNEERYLQRKVWRHEEMRTSIDDDSVSEYLIIPDRDRVI